MSRFDFDENGEDISIEKPFDFSSRATIGCGGVAREAFFPKTEDALIRLLKRLELDGKAYCVLGGLSNVLPPDGVSKRVVVSTKQMKTVCDDDGVFVQAGVTVGALLQYCKTTERSGAEFLAGIPCTVGGALFMNAGVSGEYISQIVESVTAYIDGKKEVLSCQECDYAYKHSSFMQNGGIILSAKLKLAKSTKESVLKNIARYAERRAHLPKGKSMGCVFKNPKDGLAGKIIEGAGLKGLRVGGAKISDAHANFIINDGGATSEDIKKLIAFIKKAVFAQYKISLQEEIRYLD